MAQMFNDENFDSDVLKSKEPVLVDFFAEWCGPCKMMSPLIDEISVEFEGKWKIGKYNVDNGGKFAEQYGVQSIPTLIFFKNGEEVDRAVGFQSKEALLKKLEA
jgi:thioredoxin 1